MKLKHIIHYEKHVCSTCKNVYLKLASIVLWLRIRDLEKDKILKHQCRMSLK